MKKLLLAVILGSLLVPSAASAHDGVAGKHDDPRFTPKPGYVKYDRYIRQRVDEHGRVIVQRHGRRIVYPRGWHWFSRYRRLHRVHYGCSHENMR